ncbi:MAG: hypothetical protein ABR865_06080 [Terracidiphilus sp.]|jgi:hypothetical protein
MSEKDPKQVLDTLTEKSSILLALCASPLFFLFAYLGDPGRGRAAAISAFLILLCAKIFWSLRKYVLFWFALTIVTLSQIPLIWLIPWSNRDYPGVVLLPLALPDFAIIYGILKLVEKMTRGSRPAADTNLS